MSAEMNHEDCDCEHCHEFAVHLRMIMQLLLRQTLLDLSVWDDILKTLGTKMSLLTPIFTSVMQSERVELIELFCSHGFNPFSKAQESTAPAIFGLAKKTSDTDDYGPIFKAIFKGMEKYYMRVVAGFKEYDNDRDWQETGTLLDKAIKHNPNLASYLIEKSNPKVGVPLHWATVFGEKPIIKALIKAGLSPYEEGSLYLTKEDMYGCPTLADRFIDESLHNKEWNIRVDAEQLSTMRKNSLSEFIYQCCKDHLTDSSTSLEGNVGSDTENKSNEEILDYEYCQKHREFIYECCKAHLYGDLITDSSTSLEHGCAKNTE